MNDKQNEPREPFAIGGEPLCLIAMAELMRLRSSVEHAMMPITQTFGLTPMQATVLHLINVNRDSTVGTVFRSLDINQGNASSLCKRLESDGFIIRRRSSQDERRVVLMLTSKGEEAISVIEREAAKRHPSFNGISNEEKTDIFNSLSTLTDFAKKLNNFLNNED